MEPYFRYYCRHFVAGMVIFAVIVIISAIVEVIKWIALFIRR